MRAVEEHALVRGDVIQDAGKPKAAAEVLAHKSHVAGKAEPAHGIRVVACGVMPKQDVTLGRGQEGVKLSLQLGLVYVAYLGHAYLIFARTSANLA